MARHAAGAQNAFASGIHATYRATRARARRDHATGTVTNGASPAIRSDCVTNKYSRRNAARARCNNGATVDVDVPNVTAISS